MRDIRTGVLSKIGLQYKQQKRESRMSVITGGSASILKSTMKEKQMIATELELFETLYGLLQTAEPKIEVTFGVSSALRSIVESLRDKTYIRGNQILWPELLERSFLNDRRDAQFISKAAARFVALVLAGLAEQREDGEIGITHANFLMIDCLGLSKHFKTETAPVARIVTRRGHSAALGMAADVPVDPEKVVLLQYLLIS
jgi:hypothetical protein